MNKHETFRFDNKEYKIPLTYALAIGEFTDKFDIDLCAIFVDEEATMMAMQRVLMDDLLCLRMMEYFMDGDRDLNSIANIATYKDLEHFRERFWSAVGAFSGPLKKGLLDQMWTLVKKELKNADLSKLISEESLSLSNPEESQKQTS